MPNTEPLDEPVLALHKPLGALEEPESVTPVQSVSKAVRLEPVIPEAIRVGLVVLPKKHDDVFWAERKASLLYIT